MKKLAVIIIFIILFFIGALLWYHRGVSAVNPQNTASHIFVVSKGAGLNAIASELKNEGLINDELVFRLFIKQKGLEQKLQAGTFRLSPAMNAETIAKQLTTGTLDVWITVPEGKRAQEIADIMSDKLLQYNDSWRQTLEENEGYLFPDTYLIPKNADVEQVVHIMRSNFDTKYASVQNPKGLSQHDIVTLASLIEREAKHDVDRPLVSSVMHNRLDINMALQIDATIQYALGYNQYERTWWKKNLTLQDLDIQSPYNTYDNPGMPPGPIANPGLAALQAAANPDETNYIYYISDSQGVNHYARTLAEHNANITKFGLDK